MTTAPHSIRPFTERQRQIADGIGRGLSYAEIAGELARINGTAISVHTVAAHVRNMANLIDGADELPPRWRIFMVVKQHEWSVAHVVGAEPPENQLVDTG